MTNETLWNACKSVLDRQQEPLEISRVAEAAGIPETDVIARLIEHTITGRRATFRYPPLPCAAIVQLSD